MAHIKLLFSVALLFAICTAATAQDYLVTAKGDTVLGELKPLTYGPDKKLQVVGSDRKKTIYPMFQVRQFTIKGETFQPIKGPNGYAFMKLTRAGYLSLYNFQLPNQVTYDGLYLQKLDGTGVEVPNLSFKKILQRFLEDCPAVASKIDNGTYGRKDLIAIVDEYNTCVTNKTSVQTKAVEAKATADKKISAWDVLEQKVRAQADFEGKTTALDMIADIKGKIGRGEKIPNFLLDGLKSTLNQDQFKVELDNALKEVN